MITKINIIQIVLLLAIGLAYPSRAQTTRVLLSNQQAGLHWMMGNSIYWMTMNRGSRTPVVMKDKHALGTGGASVATDPGTGNLLFYTDGSTVYNARHIACATCENLKGDPAFDQPSAICPLPSTPSQYLIFTNSAAGIFVSAIETDAALSVPWKAQPVGPQAGSALITVPAPNGRDYYAIYQLTANSNSLQFITIDQTSTTTFTPRAVTITGAAPAFTAKSFAYNNFSKRLAITPVSGPVILATLGDHSLDFTGTVAGTEKYEVSDSEFTLKGDYLFISKKGQQQNDGGVFRYDMAAKTLTSVLGTKTINGSYDLQLSPDGKLYQIYQRTGGVTYWVGRFTNPGHSNIAQVKYDQNFNSKATVRINQLEGTRFPSFLPAKNLEVTIDFDFTGTCLKAPTTFFPNTIPTADSVQWSPLSGATNQPWSWITTFTSPANSITMTAFYDGQGVPVTKPVSLTNFNGTLKLPRDTIACGCELEFPKTKNPDGTAIARCDNYPFKLKAGGSHIVSYLWSTGSTTEETEIDSVGYYYVVATDANGCTAFRGTTVNEYGQNFVHNNFWYFGNKAWVNFTPEINTKPVATAVNNMDTEQGCNLACDYMGNPIFYTDGMTVWNKKGQEIATQIGGSSATQVEVVQVPGDTTLFYIFSPKAIDGNPGQYEMRYSLFDLKQKTNNELGAVVKKNQLLFSPSTERVYKGNGWLVAHEYGNNVFRAYTISEGGIGTPRTSAIGTVHDMSTGTMKQGQIKVDSALAVAVSRISSPVSQPGDFNRVDYFRFDVKSGALTDYQPLNCENRGEVYGVAISKGGTKVFASIRKGDNSKLLEFIVKDPANLDINKRPRPRNQPPVTLAMGNGFGSMNYAVDGELYMISNNGLRLGRISAGEAHKDNRGNVTYGKSYYNPHFITLPPNSNGRFGLPTWQSNNSGYSALPSLAAAPNPICLGVATRLTLATSSKIDTYTWDLDDDKGGGKIPNKTDTLIIYEKAKKYNPVVALTNRCIQKQTCTVTLGNLLAGIPGLECDDRANHKSSLKVFLPNGLLVNEGLKAPDIPNPSELCTTSYITADANSNNPDTGQPRNGADAQLSFKWAKQDQTDPKTAIIFAASRTWRFTQPDVVNVFVENIVTHCRTEQLNIVIADMRPKLKDITGGPICQNSLHDDFDADPSHANANTRYEWKINGGKPVGNKSGQAVNTKQVGRFVYEVTATFNDPDPAKQCTNNKAIIVDVWPAPNVRIKKVSPHDCTGNDGKILITFNPNPPSTSHYTYVLSSANWPTPKTGENIAAGQTEAITSIAPGVYNVAVTDQDSQCIYNGQVPVSGPDVFDWEWAIEGNNCSPVAIRISTKNNEKGNPVVITRYRISDYINATLEEKALSPLGRSFVPAYKFPAPAATYTIEVKDISDCTIIKNITINPQPVPKVEISQSCLTLTGSGATSYEWSADVPNAITGPTTGPTINMTPNSGVVTYTVKGIEGTCPGNNFIKITVLDALKPSITSSNSCNNSITLTASPAGNYTYQWKKNGLINDPANTGGSVVADLADDGSKWTVMVGDQANTCQAESSPFEAKIAGSVAAAVSSNTACQGKKFTLTATTTATDPTFTWYFNGHLIKEATDTQYTGSEDGNYTVVVSKRGCNMPAEIQVVGLPNPVSNLPNRIIICTDAENIDPGTNQAVLNPGTFASYEWKKEEQIFSHDQEIITKDPGKYQVTFTADNGCTATRKTDVVLDCVPIVTAPNTIKPSSNESLNRNFFVNSFYITEEFQIIIFNRWGQIVFQSTERNFKWNGGFLNDLDHPVPGDVYAYIVRYNGKYKMGEGTQEKKGGILVIR